LGSGDCLVSVVLLAGASTRVGVPLGCSRGFDSTAVGDGAGTGLGAGAATGGIGVGIAAGDAVGLDRSNTAAPTASTRTAAAAAITPV
jgi:hypothetical protein